MDMSTSIDYDYLLNTNLANVSEILNEKNIIFSTLFISDVDEVEYDHGEMDGGSSYIETRVVWSQYLIAVEEKDDDYTFYTFMRNKSGPINLSVMDKYYNNKIESLNEFISHYGCYEYPRDFIHNLSKSNFPVLKQKLELALMEADLEHVIPTDFPLYGSEPNFLYEILKSDWRFLEESLSKIINIVGQYAPSQFAYVDENGNNILMTYCEHVSSWDKDLAPMDIQAIIDFMPHSTCALNNDQKSALDLARENFAQLRKKDYSYHSVDYIETLLKV